MSIKCIYCGTEAINATTDKNLKVCCCYKLHNRNGVVTQYHNNRKPTHYHNTSFPSCDTSRFKAVDKETKQWIEGDLVRRTYHHPDGRKETDYFILSFDVWLDDKGVPISQSGCECKVIPETICHFSGLYDGTLWEELSLTEQENFLCGGNTSSDWQGKPIFTNDIVMNGMEKLICVRRKTDFILKKENGRPQTISIIHKCRVKRNLHDDIATGGICQIERQNIDVPY
ncbi:MAG: hypothetical protein K2H01_11030 [Ruminococcus sp.]|nr:hypothetical protein [Ruminococcus sp.]